MGSSHMSNLKKIAISLFIVSSALSLTSASSAPPSESPSADGELICHTDNPAECYPKVFSATEEFQVVREDQDLPPGLHVQLDIQTGQKRAKLYNPEEKNPELEGLPVDRSVVIVDQEESQDDKPKIPPGAPAYEPVGIVKAPNEKNEGFIQALDTVKKYSSPKGKSVKPGDLDKALEDLEDLSHGMYYGLQIAEDADALHTLFCLLSGPETAQEAEKPLTERVDFLASSILASAIRNNKPALRAVEGAWDTILEKQCVSNPKNARTPKSELYTNLEPTTGPASVEEAAEAHSTRLNLAVLDGLLKSPKIKEQFLAHDGMKNFLRILLRKEEVWDARKAKVARIVADTFLDEEVGAVLGVWPTVASVTDTSVCAEGGSDSLGEGCWEYHLEVISRDPKDAEWSQPLLDMLRQRLGSESTRRRDEL
ncbi:hypothetical protein F5Y04DRAFT_158773 [Hypomontagnella monticulosa]|nr:hypothetical protein F5Y04DRAFT_158773 [Hypomontagnella monticulosa]